jgi:uncharacterized membrane protein
MTLVAQILVGLVIILRLGFFILERFLWNTRRGRATFGTTPALATESATLAASQGLYNKSVQQWVPGRRAWLGLEGGRPGGLPGEGLLSDLR